MSTYYLDHTSGQPTGAATSTSVARDRGRGLSVTTGDDIRALATLPVDTGISAVWEHRNDKIRVDSQAFCLPFFHHEFKRAAATWTRSGTTITVTKASHGLSTDDWIHVPPNGTSDLAAIPWALGGTGVYLVQVIVSDPSTFTFTGANAGATSGWLEYTCKLCEPDRYFTWTRSGTTITCTSYNAHGQGSITTNINVIINSAITAIVQTSVFSATFSSTNTFTFTGANAGATSGSGFYEHAWMSSTNVTTTVAVTSGIRNCGCRQHLTVAAGFTTGLLAYVKTRVQLDLSAWQMLSMQFQATLVQTGMRIQLCSDTAGTTPIAGCDWALHPVTPIVTARYMVVTLTPFGAATIWTASQVVSVNDLRYTTSHMTGASGVYICTGAGACGTVEPIWKTDGSTVTDGAATWTFNGYGNLPDNVNSIAIYCDIDPLLQVTGIDCLTAFKAPTNVNSLTFEHLILPPPTTVIARNTAYSVGDIRVPTPVFGSNMRYICTTAGTSHSTTEPTWNHLVGSFTTDGGSVWKNIGFQETPYLIRECHFVDDKTDITLHDGDTQYQFTGLLKQWTLGYTNPLFPPLLTSTASVGNSSIVVENSSGFIVNEYLKISDIDEYLITSNDITTNTIGISPNIVTERAIGQPVRFSKKTANLWKIRPHYNARLMTTTAAIAVDSINSTGTLADPVIYKGGYDSTFTTVVGRTYIYGFNHASYSGYGPATNSGYINIYNVHYCAFYKGINISDLPVATASGRFSVIRNCGAVSCNFFGFGSSVTTSGGISFVEYFSCSLFLASTEPGVPFLYGTVTVRVKGLYICGSRQRFYNWCFILCNPGGYISNSVFNYYGGENFFDEVYLCNGTQTAGNHGINGGILPLFVKNLKADGMYSGAVSGYHIQHRFLNLLDRSTSNGMYLPQTYNASAATYAPWIMSENHQNIVGSIRWEQYGASVINDTSVSGFFWRGYVTSTMFSSVMPCRLPIPIRIKMTNGVSCSFSIKMRRDSTNLTCGIRIETSFNYLDISPDIEQLITVGANTDEDVTVTFTPTRTGIVEPKIIVYSTDTTSSFWIGQVTKITG